MLFVSAVRASLYSPPPARCSLVIPALLSLMGVPGKYWNLSQATFRSKRHINQVKNRLLRECIIWSPNVGCSETLPSSWLHAVPPTLCLWGGSWEGEERREAIGFPVSCSKVTSCQTHPIILQFPSGLIINLWAFTLSRVVSYSVYSTSIFLQVKFCMKPWDASHRAASTF